jgi:predicted hydrocarbon binding protein
MIEGAQELLGMECLKRVMQELPSQSFKQNGGMALSVEDTRLFPFMLEKLYGVRGGRGLAVRIGRSTFQQVLKQYGQNSGLLDQSFRLLPGPRRLHTGLHLLANIFEQQFKQPAEVLDQGTHWIWRAENCLNCCSGYSTQNPGCYMMVGILQEFMTWASGGRFYPVVEVECGAASRGHTCVFRIEKRPQD